MFFIKKKIALIEDARSDTAEMVNSLQKCAYDVIVFHDESGIIQYLQNNRDSDALFDILLIDAESINGIPSLAICNAVDKIYQVPHVFLLDMGQELPEPIMLSDTGKNCLIRSSHPTVIQTCLNNAFQLFEYNQNTIHDVSSNQIKTIATELKMTEFAIEKAQVGIFQVGDFGDIYYVNEKACETLGYTKKELKSKKIWEVDPNFSKETWIAGRRKKKEIDGNIRESQHLCKDGRIIPVKIAVNYLNIENEMISFSFATDLTQEKEAQQKIIASRNQLELALEGSESGLWDWNIRSGTVSVDERWARIMGYNLEELQPVDETILTKFCLEEYKKQRQKLLEEHFQGQSELYKLEMEVVHKSGEVIWIIEKAKVSEWDEDGNPARITGTFSNISERKQREKKIEKLMNDKELLIQEVNHRVKNNLLLMRSIFSLQSSSTESVEAKEILQDVQDRISIMLFLYQHLHQTNENSSVNLKEIMDGIIHNITQTYTQDNLITIESVVEPLIVPVNTSIHVGIMVNELFTNAIKYAFPRKSGAIRIFIKGTSNNGINISIEDNGIGSVRNLNDDENMGFGLNLVQTLVYQYNGEIEIVKDNGTKIFITLFDVHSHI